jgi:hypothetical protein
MAPPVPAQRVSRRRAVACAGSGRSAERGRRTHLGAGQGRGPAGHPRPPDESAARGRRTPPARSSVGAIGGRRWVSLRSCPEVWRVLAESRSERAPGPGACPLQGRSAAELPPGTRGASIEKDLKR